MSLSISLSRTLSLYLPPSLIHFLSLPILSPSHTHSLFHTLSLQTETGIEVIITAARCCSSTQLVRGAISHSPLGGQYHGLSTGSNRYVTIRTYA